MRYVPHTYQEMTTKHILQHPGAGVFLKMGLGKTSVTLSAIMELMYDSMAVDKVLIVAMRKVAENTWQEEAAKWDCFRGLTFSAILGSAKERIAATSRKADVYIINRENVVWLMEYLRWKPKYDLLILDESTSFKDSSTKRWKALRKVRKCFKRTVLLTGTPRPNSLIDLWAQIYLLDGGERLGKTLTEYRNRYFVPDKRDGMRIYSWKVRDAAAEQEIYDRISDICVSLKSEDYLKMPDKLPPVTVHVQLDEKAKRHYKELEREYVATIQGQEITALSAAAVSTKLLQLANGAVYNSDGKTIAVHRAKLDALREIYEVNAGNPILVFYGFLSDRDWIKKEIPQARLLEGKQEIEDWNAGKVPILLAHPASAGYGLNLQAGGHIIVWYGLTWSLEQYQQANARLERQGQQEPVVIHHLVAQGTIDEQVMRALEHKRSGQDAMMEAVKLMVKGAKNGN